MSLIKHSGYSFPAVFSDLFDDTHFFNQHFLRSGGFPAANVKETADQYQVELSVPGFKKEELRVHVDQDVLTVSAEHKDEKNEEKPRYTRHEFSHRSFSRSFQLPATADGEKVQAKYENGILNIGIAKKGNNQSALKKKEIAVE